MLNPNLLLNPNLPPLTQREEGFENPEGSGRKSLWKASLIMIRAPLGDPVARRPWASVLAQTEGDAGTALADPSPEGSGGLWGEPAARQGLWDGQPRARCAGARGLGPAGPPSTGLVSSLPPPQLISLPVTLLVCERPFPPHAHYFTACVSPGVQGNLCIALSIHVGSLAHITLSYLNETNH